MLLFFLRPSLPHRLPPTWIKTNKKKKPPEENFSGLNQLITKKKYTPADAHTVQSRRTGVTVALSHRENKVRNPYNVSQAFHHSLCVSRRHFLRDEQKQRRTRRGALWLKCRWCQLQSVNLSFVTPRREREKKKTKWLFEAFAERSKKLVSVSAALTEMTQNCKTGATVKSNCPP